MARDVDNGAALTIAAVLVRHAAPNLWKADDWERIQDGLSFSVDFNGYKGVVNVVTEGSHPYYSIQFTDKTINRIHIESLYSAIQLELKFKSGLA